MKVETLKKLIKSTKKSIQELVVLKNKIEDNIESLQLSSNRLDEEFEKEKKWLEEQPTGSYDFQNFFDSIKLRQSKLEEAIKEKQKELTKVQDKLHDSYIEEKKYKHLHDKLIAKELKLEAKMETQTLDEIAKQRHGG